jgi:hypothetical protein
MSQGKVPIPADDFVREMRGIVNEAKPLIYRGFFVGCTLYTYLIDQIKYTHMNDDEEDE